MRKSISLCLLALLLPCLATAQENSFLRFVERSAQWQGALQTSISSYKNDAGQQVDLFSAVHIADRSYYETLNHRFDAVEILLFELVTDDEEFPRSDGRNSGNSTLGLIQTMIGEFLELDFQLQAIDYSPDHFQRADLSARELAAIMESKDESFFSMFMNMALAQMAAEQNAIANRDLEPGRLSLMTLITALSSENQAQALKFLLAQEMGRVGDLALNPVQESQLTILGDRNRVALQALEEFLSQGAQHIGLFYGAAHMPGLERELIETMGFTLVSREWLTAWDIPSR